MKLPEIEEHTVSLFSTWRSAWASCQCGWRSIVWQDVPGAQWQWMNHIAALVKLPRRWP